MCTRQSDPDAGASLLPPYVHFSYLRGRPPQPRPPRSRRGEGAWGKTREGGKRPNEESYPHSTHLSRLSGGFSSFSLPLLEAILFLAAEKRGWKKARIRSSHPPQKGT